MVATKLADVCASMVDWKSKRKQLEIAFLQMMVTNEEERGWTRVMLKVMSDKQDKLNCQIAENLCELMTIVADNQHLVITLKKKKPNS